MRLLPRSIRSRLLIAGIVLTGAALLLASLMIHHGIYDLVRRSLNERLDAQIALLLRSVRADGTVDGAMLGDLGPFTQHRRGWGWTIETPARTYISRDAPQLDSIVWEGPPGREGHFRGGEESLLAGRTGESYLRTLENRTPAGLVRVTAFAPIHVFDGMLRSALTPILLILGGLSVVLLAATCAQLHFGLKPLSRLRLALTAVRSGSLKRIPDSQPAELAPLAHELNALLDENEAALTRARGHVSNLAHSLKTPLATLSIRIAELDNDPSGRLTELVSQIDGAIRHHLGRARAASPGSPGGPVVSVAASVDELALALGRIHADRRIRFTAEVPAGLTLKCDPQDVAEMLGNLLDNAWKWARHDIRLSARASGKMACIIIEDDGPGLSAEAIEEALVPGRRLDERGEGHGFGLPIARELAELHGGSLTLEASPRGGLRVALMLPR
ncbi:HAMP domain-containing sensor histidine kinase [Novosphingobium resinovorum]|uniref:sensor histidine kinase n=1 Tax=Novosphingobium resinovorum TaxID=158500 RepID=UPI002ED544A2|nr:HAMP domain-containing sensor histidine kinase [Novosphingobium resinovorum]